LVFVL
jgi:hypothetical protein